MVRIRWSVLFCLGLLLIQALPLLTQAQGPEADIPAEATIEPVVVATFDTGTNPFHPCFRAPDRTHPAEDLPDYPSWSSSLDLTFEATYDASLAASQEALDDIQPWTLYHVPGTKLSFYGSDAARNEFVDYYPHGSQASSMIACEEYGMGANAQLVVLNAYWNRLAFADLMVWVAAQDWIDVVHLNIQDTPYPGPTSETRAISDLIASGKLVTIAAGNGVSGLLVNYPQEVSSYNGPPGSLIIGATDNRGYTLFSNLDPHVSADGAGTTAAAPYGYGSTGFSGTSSASPLATGYVAWVLGALRAEWGHNGTGLLTIPAGHPVPTTGPLADGHLAATELHEVVRKTADPLLQSSRYDGGSSLYGTPGTSFAPAGAQYAKAGYGKVSEHTFADAVAVASGNRSMPERSEDTYYAISEAIRESYWGGIWGV